MAEQPALHRIHVIGYAANDRDFPTVSLIADPRVAGYQVPKDLSVCPDKRYPNHVFTGAQPISGDQRVRHVWEILPSPWVPFTRYDDDLGPIQGRRRSVKNEGQVASLTAEKRTTYEAREGSAIVYTELEEAWSIKVDEDGNSLFPIRDRDLYDDRLGPIKERRQLFVPTGEESASLEYVAPNIIQTTYEPYNEFLSYKVTTTYKLNGPIRREDIYDAQRGAVQRLSQVVYDTGDLQASLVNENSIITQTSFVPVNNLVVDKIVETYRVSGPALGGSATNEVGQVATIDSFRRARSGFTQPLSSATQSFEAVNEDAETLTLRVTTIPQVFSAKTFSVERPDPVPQKFRVLVPTTTTQESLAGTVTTPPSLAAGDLSKSESQQTVHVKRISTSARSQPQLPKTLEQKATNENKQIVTIKETLKLGDTTDAPTATKDIQSEALGDGNFIVTETSVSKLFDRKSVTIERPDPLPSKFRFALPSTTVNEVIESATDPSPVFLSTPLAKELQKREERATEFTKSVSTTSRTIPTQPTILSGKTYTREYGGGLATVEETVTTSEVDNPETGLRVVSSEKEALGGGEFLIRTIKLDADPTALKGQQYDDTFDVVLPFEEKVVSPPTAFVDKKEYVPQDAFHTLERTTATTDAVNKLKEVDIVVDDIVNVSLPDVLESVTYVQSEGSGVGGSNSVGGEMGSYSASSSKSTSIDIFYEINNGYSGPAKAKKYIYFVEQSQATIASVLFKTNSIFWPILRPKSHTITIFGASVSANKQRSVGPDSGSISSSYDVNTSVSTIRLPLCINDEIQLRPDDGGSFGSRVTTIEVPPQTFEETVNLPEVAPSISPMKLPATSPKKFEAKTYLYSLNIQPYRYGLMRVDATTVNIEEAMIA